MIDSAAVDGRPLCFLLTPGQAADCRQAPALLEGLALERLIGDRGGACPPARVAGPEDTDAIRGWCEQHGVEAVIPSRRNRKPSIPHDSEACKRRHKVENLLGRIVLRKRKTARRYAGFVSLAFALVNVQLCP